jgi:hypothetical protein
MATLTFLGTEKKVFTPVSSALGALSNGPGTIIALVKQTTTGAQDFGGLTNSAFSAYYHGLINGTITASTLGDDDDVGSVAASATWPQDTTNWYLVACDWASTAAVENFRWRNQTTLGAWTTSASATNAAAAKAGPGTGGWFSVGYLGDGSVGAKTHALIAVWNVRFGTSDYNAAWNKTSDLWTHPLGHPIFLTQLNSTTPTDLAGGSTYSSANSSGTALTGADPDNWTFDGTGPVVRPAARRIIRPRVWRPAGARFAR